jgi:hypothetical protein
MSDFVYDLTSLPTGKVDGKPRQTPANQYVNCDEWNTSMQASLDLRTALRTLNGGSSASRATGVNSGDISIGTANGLSLAGQVLSLAAAVAGGANGALLGTDKTKLDALSGTNSGDITIGAFGSAPAAVGASLAGQVLTLQPADATHPGSMTAGVQTFGGAKTFSADAAFDGHVLLLDGGMVSATAGLTLTMDSLFTYPNVSAGADRFHAGAGFLIGGSSAASFTTQFTALGMFGTTTTDDLVFFQYTAGKKAKVGSVNNGAGAAAVVLGAISADASVDATCKLLSVGTGLDTGGTYVEKFYVDKAGAIVASGMTHVRAESTGGPSMTGNASTTIVYDTEVNDVLGEYDPATGIFTAAKTGYYNVTASAILAAHTFAATQSANAQLVLLKNTSTFVGLGSFYQLMDLAGTNSYSGGSMFSSVLHLTAGDTLKVQLSQNNGPGTAINLATTHGGSYNFFTVDRLA